MSFVVSDLVFLQVSPLKGVMKFGRWDKLGLKYIEPFEILWVVGDVVIIFPWHIPFNLSSSFCRCFTDIFLTSLCFGMTQSSWIIVLLLWKNQVLYWLGVSGNCTHEILLWLRFSRDIIQSRNLPKKTSSTHARKFRYFFYLLLLRKKVILVVDVVMTF